MLAGLCVELACADPRYVQMGNLAVAIISCRSISKKHHCRRTWQVEACLYGVMRTAGYDLKQAARARAHRVHKMHVRVDQTSLSHI